ncbi:MAG: carboxymuconolactone decarboxylase family protein [Candidatus Thermoplasmatota archaeon]
MVKNKNIEEKRKYREKMNEYIFDLDEKNIKRFFSLDSRAYDSGAIDKKTKELMGLVASTVLRCDDCIFYHLDQCKKLNVTRKEIIEAINIALVVGGSITIPHIRYLFECWQKLGNKQ